MPFEKHHGTVSTGGWVIKNLQFADEIDKNKNLPIWWMAWIKRLPDMAWRLVLKRQSWWQTSDDKKITVSGQELKTVNQFKYLGAILSEEGSTLHFDSSLCDLDLDSLIVFQILRWISYSFYLVGSIFKGESPNEDDFMRNALSWACMWTFTEQFLSNLV